MAVAGRQQFDRVTVIRAQPGKQLVKVEIVDSTNVPISTQNQTLVLAPVGKVGKVLGGYVLIPGIAAATGTHTLSLQPNMGSVSWLQAGSPATDALSWERGILKATGTGATMFPTTEAAQAAALGQMWFDSNVGLVITYNNGSNTAQTGSRIMRFQVLYEDVV